MEKKELTQDQRTNFELLLAALVAWFCKHKKSARVKDLAPLLGWSEGKVWKYLELQPEVWSKISPRAEIRGSSYSPAKSYLADLLLEYKARADEAEKDAINCQINLCRPVQEVIKPLVKELGVEVCRLINVHSKLAEAVDLEDKASGGDR